MDYTVNVALVNGKTDNKPVNRSYSLKDFSKLLSAPIVAKEKDGNAFCACHFERQETSDKGGWKLAANVSEMTLFVVEYDHEGTIADVYDSRAWREYQYFLYTTHSHCRVTKSNPDAEERFRLVFPLAVPIPVDLHPAVFQWALKQSENKLDDTVGNPDRLWYFPRIENPKAPFAYYENEGEFLDYRKLDLAPIKKYIPPPISFGNVSDKYALKALENEKNKLSNTGANRNQQLFKSTAALAQLVHTGALSENDIEVHLVEACGSNGLIADDGEKTVKKTIQSGLKTGKKTPRVVPEKPVKIQEKKQVKEEANAIVLDENYDPAYVAGLFLHGKFLKYINETFYFYTGTGYEDVKDIFIEKKIKNFLVDFVLAQKKGNPIPFPRTRSKISDILYNTKLDRLSTDEVPSYNGTNKPNLILLQNGIWDTESEKLLSHTPDYLSTNNLGFCYDSKAVCPQWEAFLKTQCSNASLLQEWFGLNLVDDMSYQKLFFALGLPRTGKSTALSVLKLLVGEKNYVTSTFTALERNFSLSPFIGKLSAIFPDAHFSATKGKDPVGVIETIKSISGEDDVLIDRKWKDLLSLKLRTRLTFACNVIPRFNDETSAIIERLLVVSFGPVVSEEQRDIDLFKKLKTEVSGIFNWALIGLKRLREKKRFSAIEPDLKDAFAKMGNPLLAWQEECCVFALTGRCERKKAFQSYSTWCDENKHYTNSSTSFFAKMMNDTRVSVVKVHGTYYFKGFSI